MAAIDNNFDYTKKYYKVIRNDFVGGVHSNPLSHDMHYHVGMNTPYKEAEMYFTNIENIFSYLLYGSYICEISIPKDVTVIYDPEEMVLGGRKIPGWYCNAIYINSITPITSKLIKKLIRGGAVIDVDNYNLFHYALHYNREVWDYLVKTYPEIVLKFYNDRRDI